MTTNDHDTSRRGVWLVGLMLALSASACTRDEVDQAGDRLKRGAERAYEKLPPASEVKEDLKQAGKAAGETLREIAHDVEREARETRELIRERAHDSRER